MKIEVKLLKAQKGTDEGFPLVFEITHQGKRKQKIVGHSFPKHFSDDAKALTPKHPDFDVLQPRIMDLQLKARRIVLSGETSIERAYAELFKEDRSGASLQEFAAQWMAQQREMMAVYQKKKDVTNRNRVAGYVASVENALVQFNNHVPAVAVADLDYETLMVFRRAQEKLGNSGNTIHLYLRTMRMLYNKACLEYRLPDNRPFRNVFAGLKTKSYDTKKKHLDDAAVRVLEGLPLSGEKARSRDMWLLQFYLAGADLTDVYHLKKHQIRKGRVWFERGKVRNSSIDLKLHPKALAIMEKYPSADEWVFPWRKDVDGYKTFRSKTQKLLKEIQSYQNAHADAAKDKTLRIDVLPGGGHLAPKVARHTFANLGKEMMIDNDVLRELMGHRRNDVDNFYKDKHKESVRDAALWQIIG